MSRPPLAATRSTPLPETRMPRDDESVQGVLELHPKGYGFLRNPARHYQVQAADAYVPAPLIQKYGLRGGVHIAGPAEPQRKASEIGRAHV